jgi:nucleoside-diphosphate-sugar epimerase
MSPTARAFAEAVTKRVPGVDITFRVDPARQAILDSWPDSLDDSCARQDWGWKHEFDLDAMSEDLIPKIREMVGK